jgi:hypothetical protein
MRAGSIQIHAPAVYTGRMDWPYAIDSTADKMDGAPTLNALTSPAPGSLIDVPITTQLYWSRCWVILCLRPRCVSRALSTSGET